MIKVSKYQQEIITALKNGARLQCTEGSIYKAWLVLADGSKKPVRRDSANNICLQYETNLVFGKKEGIYWR